MTDYSALSVFWMYTLMFLFAAGALCFLYWAVRSGAVRDSEAPKFRMMEDDGGSHGDR
jgi:nitrogen fixation-related uncharacterized protein